MEFDVSSFWFRMWRKKSKLEIIEEEEEEEIQEVAKIEENKSVDE